MFVCLFVPFLSHVRKWYPEWLWLSGCWKPKWCTGCMSNHIRLCFGNILECNKSLKPCLFTGAICIWGPMVQPHPSPPSYGRHPLRSSTSHCHCLVIVSGKAWLTKKTMPDGSVSVSGNRNLKGSQTYPREFGFATVRVWKTSPNGNLLFATPSL